jgi:hypothetical protein
MERIGIKVTKVSDDEEEFCEVQIKDHFFEIACLKDTGFSMEANLPHLLLAKKMIRSQLSVAPFKQKTKGKKCEKLQVHPPQALQQNPRNPLRFL